jgi:creatinine amidohydrolase
MEQDKWIFTENPAIMFENTSVGRIKKAVWDMSEEEVNRWIAEDLEIPSPSELGKTGCYIQNTPRRIQNEKRRKNDIVLVPIGCSENHGDHCPTGHDTFQCTMFLEGIRRYTAKQGREVNLAFPPLLYGGHPYHHIGMPGTIILPQEALMETIIAVLLGLWDDGYRKIILINNHGHLWNLVLSIQEFCKRYQLPGIYQVFDWHRASREFFYPGNGKPHSMETSFVHADESETSLGLLMFPEMIKMEYAVDTKGTRYLSEGWFDTSVDDFRRPHRWDEGEGHAAIEAFGTPEGVVGSPTLATADKAKRPITAITKLLIGLISEILEKYPAGKVPPCEGMSFRTEAEMAPYLKEPQSKGWKSVYSLPRIGPVESL